MECPWLLQTGVFAELKKYYLLGYSRQRMSTKRLFKTVYNSMQINESEAILLIPNVAN